MLASGNEQQQQQQNKCLCAVLSTRAAVACMYVSWWCVCFRCGCNCPARGQQHIALMTTTNAKERQVFFAYHIAYMFKKAITLFFYDLQAKKVPRKTIDLTKSICCSINLQLLFLCTFVYLFLVFCWKTTFSTNISSSINLKCRFCAFAAMLRRFFTFLCAF